MSSATYENGQEADTENWFNEDITGILDEEFSSNCDYENSHEEDNENWFNVDITGILDKKYFSNHETTCRAESGSDAKDVIDSYW